MRLNLPSLFSLLLAPLAVSPLPTDDVATPPPDRKAAVAVEDVPKATVFNGQEVPPMIQLEGPKFKEQIAHGYWLVKAFSPYCPHCVHLAPKWQTIYEYYYTSKPVPASSGPSDPSADLNSFSRFYNFKFASLDCIAYQDLCVEIDATAWPAILLYKDGVQIKKSTGDKTMEKLSGLIEESLEIIKPGSRPKEGIELPKVGAKSVEDTADTSKPPGPAKDFTKNPSTDKAVPLDKSPVNPNGKSFAFDLESFSAKVNNSLTPWFIKYYAPWCHHCQALAPAWTTMAREMQGKLDIGEVNCDEQKALCIQAGVRSYPTMKFFRGPESWDYNGLRGVGDLVDWAGKAASVGDAVQDVTMSEFESMEKTEDVLFVYFYDHAATSEDFLALERLPIHTIGRSKVVKSKDAALAKRFRVSNWPRLAVSRDGLVDVYPGQTPAEMRNVDKMVAWMKENWLALVPEMTAANSKDIMKGHFSVLAILNRGQVKTFASTKQELKAAAIEWAGKADEALKGEIQKLRDAKAAKVKAADAANDVDALRDAKLIKVEADQVRQKGVNFAWVDGTFWERWVRTTFGVSVRDGSSTEKIIIYDHDKHRYWDVLPNGVPIAPTKQAIMDLLPSTITSPPSLMPKVTGSWIMQFFWRLKAAFIVHPILATVIVFGGIASYVMGLRWLRRRRTMAHSNGVFHGRHESKEGLLGYGYNATANGKAD